jgi:hypothetical protein
MAFMAAALPWLSAGAAAYGYAKQAQTSLYNAKVAQNESNLSVNQAGAQEGMVIRAGRQQLGRQAAAFGAAGVGYGGSSETALDQSAVNDELDALNTKYHGQLTGYGYGVESQNFGSQAQGQSLLAGAALLKGIGSSYSSAPPSLAEQAGLVTPGG